MDWKRMYERCNKGCGRSINVLLVFLFNVLPYGQTVQGKVNLFSFLSDTYTEAKADSLSSEKYYAVAADKFPTEGVQLLDSIAMPQMTEIAVADTTKKARMRNWSTWRPDPKRALWLALVFPGAGQIYNRKYWKLPIIYGGFVGCIYAMRWNNQMYHDYSQAYLDIVDDDPTTQSYNSFLHLGRKVTPENQARYQELFRKRKDKYRRWRDLSFFVMVGVYALSVIDAYVDASLSEFDISDNLSMRVAPAVIPSDNKFVATRNPIKGNAVGLQCSIAF